MATVTRNKQDGFTLMELLVALTICATLFIGLQMVWRPMLMVAGDTNRQSAETAWHAVCSVMSADFASLVAAKEGTNSFPVQIERVQTIPSDKNSAIRLADFCIMGKPLFNDLAESTLRRIRYELAGPHGGPYQLIRYMLPFADVTGAGSWTAVTLAEEINNAELALPATASSTTSSSQRSLSDRFVIFTMTGNDAYGVRTTVMPLPVTRGGK